MPDIEEHEIAHSEAPQGYISFESLTRDLGHSDAFMKNNSFFDVNYLADAKSRGSDFVNAYIDTAQIHLIETPEINYYTLKLVNNNPNERSTIFYNLIFELDNATDEVVSFILQYDPNLVWGMDKTKDFKGNITKFENSYITIEELNEGILLDGQSRSTGCLVLVNRIWYCENPHNHPSNQHDDQSDVEAYGCGGFAINVYEPCPENEIIDAGDSGGGGGDGSSNGHNGGGTTNSDGNDEYQTIILAECDGGFYASTEDSPGDPEEDCEDEYADYFDGLLCEGFDRDEINYWVDHNLEEATDIYNFLIETVEFGDCVDLNIEDKVTIHESLKNMPCQNTMLEQSFEINGPLSLLFKQIFDPNNEIEYDSEPHVNFSAENLNNIALGGVTVPYVLNGKINIVIKFNTQRLQNSTQLDIINTMVHEYTHALLVYYYTIENIDGFETEDIPSYGELATQFTNQSAELNGNGDQHIYMVGLIEKIAEITHSWAQQNGYSNVDMSYFEKLAWSGLTVDTDYLNIITNPTERSAIEDAISSEIFPNITGSNPKGELCD